MTPTWKKWTKEEEASLRAMRAEGYSWRAIAVALDRTENGCIRHLRDLKRGLTPVRVVAPSAPSVGRWLVTLPYVRCLDDGSEPAFYRMAEPMQFIEAEL